MKEYIVVINDYVVFQCDHLGEGLAFIEGRGAGVLSKVLTICPTKKRHDQVQKRKTPRKAA